MVEQPIPAVDISGLFAGPSQDRNEAARNVRPPC
jgi:hypothetical protein